MNRISEINLTYLQVEKIFQVKADVDGKEKGARPLSKRIAAGLFKKA
jgi:hypothetical protein